MKKIWHVFALFLLPCHVCAKTLVMATFPIPLLVESPEKGLFVHLTKEIAKRNSQEINILVLPTGKSLLAFSNNKVDGLFPAFEVHIPKRSARSNSFYDKVDYVFYKKGKPLKTLKELEGKKVGLTFRYPYVQELVYNKKIKFEFAPDDILNMRKLGQGAIEAFVAEEKSGLKALQLSGASGIEYDKEKPFSKQVVFYAFQNTTEGQQLADLFSKTIDSMKKDGTLNKILSESY